MLQIHNLHLLCSDVAWVACYTYFSWGHGWLACWCQVTRDTRERECTTLWDEPEWALHYLATTYRPYMSVASHSVLFVSTPCCVLLLWWWDRKPHTAVCWEWKYVYVQVLQSAVTKITVGSNVTGWYVPGGRVVVSSGVRDPSETVCVDCAGFLLI